MSGDKEGTHLILDGFNAELFVRIRIFLIQHSVEEVDVVRLRIFDSIFNNLIT